MKTSRPIILAALGSLLLYATPAFAASYYIDADGGNDANAGTSPTAAWATFAKAATRAYQPGDQILLQTGDTFTGKLRLEGKNGSAGSPIVISSYGTGAKPVINAAGYLAGVHLRNCRYIEVRDLEITANGGAVVDGSTAANRYGIYVDCTSGKSVNFITIDGLFIHDIYPDVATASEGANATTYMGSGVGLNGLDGVASNNIIVRNCSIERVGFEAMDLKFVSIVEILDNVMTDIGGPAIQPSRVDDLIVRGNVVNRSGSYLDPRMHGRGSGIWPWTCERVLIEKNRFMNARGRGDSCGIHIDFNNRDVVVQYNLSVNNAGGFIEILGNNFNCTYRYNISINDGARVGGVTDQGTLANDSDGKIIFISGYVGETPPPQGPTYSYLYNNTIYVKSGMKATFSIGDTAVGLLVANNIFYVVPTTTDTTSTSTDNYTQNMVNNVFWQNNLYQRTGIVPVFANGTISFTETSPRIGDPQFALTGGLLPENYIPQAIARVANKGIVINKLPDDTLGLQVGLAVTQDFFGNPIIGLPDLGAVELTSALALPSATFNRTPAFISPDAAEMVAVSAPSGTEYYFTENTGNYGGDDSGWQTSPVYRDTGLLPNTTYAYTVTLRDTLQQAGTPSPSRQLKTPVRSPFAEPLLLSENFSTAINPANATAPFLPKTWFIAYELEAQSDSTTVASGLLRTAYGYDRTMVLWYSDRQWNPAYGCRFSGDWKIDTTLDLHQGLIVGIGEFDPVSGELLRRVKQATIGDLVDPVAGQTGTFSLEVSVAELTAAGVNRSNLMGLFIEHLGAATPLRNDVYLVDNLQLIQLGVQADSDGDGIPDAVETSLGLAPGNSADGAADRDGDLWTNSQEFLTGTDINNPNDHFRVTFTPEVSGAELHLPGANVLAGRLYLLENSTNLTNWTVLNAFSGSQVGPGTNQVLPVALPGPRDFFRVRVEWE
jgi:hypothetical protein